MAALERSGWESCSMPHLTSSLPEVPDQMPELHWGSLGLARVVSMKGPVWLRGQRCPQHSGGGPGQWDWLPSMWGIVPHCVPSTPGRGTVVISGWVQPLSWDLQFGNELFNSPMHVKEAAPVLPWPYLGQAVAGRALKCEAASSGIAGGKKWINHIIGTWYFPAQITLQNLGSS